MRDSDRINRLHNGAPCPIPACPGEVRCTQNGVTLTTRHRRYGPAADLYQCDTGAGHTFVDGYSAAAVRRLNTHKPPPTHFFHEAAETLAAPPKVHWRDRDTNTAFEGGA